MGFKLSFERASRDTILPQKIWGGAEGIEYQELVDWRPVKNEWRLESRMSAM